MDKELKRSLIILGLVSLVTAWFSQREPAPRPVQSAPAVVQAVPAVVQATPAVVQGAPAGVQGAP